MNLTDADRVARLVSDMSDAAGTPTGFQAIFAEGAAPSEAERANYRGYGFRATATRVSGDSATATVRVERSADDQLVGETEWTAVRSDGGWKLQEAPMP